MIVRAPHLQDDVLYECYYAERRGESIDPPSAWLGASRLPRRRRRSR